MKTSPEGIARIKRHELLRLKAYLCPAGVPTIGWGSTRGVAMGMTITEQQADARLVQDLATAEGAINKNVKVPLTQGQFDALVSFVFNVGVPHFAGVWSNKDKAFLSGPSTLLKKLNRGDYKGAAEQLPLWCHARDPKTGGMVRLPGLVKRRREEMEAFLADVP
jgi:lysozyme